MIDKMNTHYSMNNPASVYDEEALTTLELVGRTTAKVNEVVDLVNDVPNIVAEDVQKHIDNGVFDKQVDKYAGELKKQIADGEANNAKRIADSETAMEKEMEATETALTKRVENAENHMETEVARIESSLGSRVNQLVGATQNGSTTLDAEVIDIRTDDAGQNHGSAGNSVRMQIRDLMNTFSSYGYTGIGTQLIFQKMTDGAIRIHFPVGKTIKVRSNHANTEELTWGGGAFSGISGNVSEESDGSHIITVPNTYTFVYNTMSKKLYMRTSANTEPFDTILLQNAYCTPIKGSLYEEQMWKELDATQTASFAYFGIGHSIQFEQDGSTGILYVVTDWLGAIKHHDKGSKDITEDAISLLPNNIVKTEDGKWRFKLDPHMTLTYNYADEKFQLRSSSDIGSNEVILVSNGYCIPICGDWVTAYLVNKVMSIYEEEKTGEDAIPEISNFSVLMNNTDKVESFLFFTDPHLSEGTDWESEFKGYMKTLGKHFNSAPVSFAVCGGDWLGNKDTYEQACFKLGLIDSKMREYFQEYYMVLGNHDTNYQGVNEAGESNTGTLTESTIRNLWYRKQGKAYYTFEGVNTKNFVFDTQLDWYPETDVYKTAQIEWYLDELKNNTAEHIVLYAHIIGTAQNESETGITEYLPMMETVTMLANAFNRRTTCTFNGVSYNFENATGKIHYVMGGHLHNDYVTTLNNIPVVLTTHTRVGGKPTFDLCLADYDKNVLHMVRVGSGLSRTVNI